MSSYPSSFALRIPEKLMEDIKALAEQNSRSVNKEIEYALKMYVLQNSASTDN